MDSDIQQRLLPPKKNERNKKGTTILCAITASAIKLKCLKQDWKHQHSNDHPKNIRIPIMTTVSATLETLDNKQGNQVIDSDARNCKYSLEESLRILGG